MRLKSKRSVNTSQYLTFFLLALFFAAPRLASAKEAIIAGCPYDLLRGDKLKITVPACQYCSDALEIQNIGNHQRFGEWTVAEQAETYDFLQRIANTWHKADYARSFLVYGKTTPNLRSERFSWEAIPFAGSDWNYWKQIKVIWNVAFGSSPATDEERIAKSLELRKRVQHLPDAYSPQYGRGKPSDDPFCNQSIIEKQRVYEGARIYVLYDHAPERFLEENPHFLIIPKRHAEKFTQLTMPEYVEAMDAAQKIGSYFQQRCPKCTLHLYHKTGQEAGQTVPHWHLHVVVVKDDAYLPSFQFPCVKTPTSCTRISSPFLHLQRKFGKLWQGYKNFILLMLPKRKLSDDQLNQRVAFYSREFKESF